MPTQGPPIDRSRLLLAYRGGEADAGEVELGELAFSLEGWSDFLTLVAEDVLLRDERGRRHPNLRVQFKARPFERGSLVTIVDVVLIGVISSAAWDGTKLLARRYWPAARRLMEGIKDAKAQNATIREAAERCQALAEYMAPEAGGQQLPVFEGLTDEPTSHRHDDLGHFGELVLAADEAMQRAAFPVQSSVAEIVAKVEEVGLIASIGPEEKRLFGRPFRPEDVPPDELMQVRKVLFHGLNKRNGWGRFSFADAPGSPDEFNQQECKVSDAAFYRRRDRYSKALHEGSTLKVWMSRRTRASGSWFWEILAADEGGQQMLFTA